MCSSGGVGGNVAARAEVRRESGYRRNRACARGIRLQSTKSDVIPVNAQLGLSPTHVTHTNDSPGLPVKNRGT